MRNSSLEPVLMKAYRGTKHYEASRVKGSVRREGRVVRPPLRRQRARSGALAGSARAAEEGAAVAPGEGPGRRMRAGAHGRGPGRRRPPLDPARPERGHAGARDGGHGFPRGGFARTPRYGRRSTRALRPGGVRRGAAARGGLLRRGPGRGARWSRCGAEARWRALGGLQEPRRAAAQARRRRTLRGGPLRVLDDPLEAGNLGIVNRARSRREVEEALARKGLRPRKAYGVRAFADLVREEPSEPDLERLVSLELRASEREPYRSVSRLLHLVCERG